MEQGRWYRLGGRRDMGQGRCTGWEGYGTACPVVSPNLYPLLLTPLPPPYTPPPSSHPHSFAATKKELHEFSPDKEPLQSMLEGEIPAMYMCKPGELAGGGCGSGRLETSVVLVLCSYRESHGIH